MYRVHLKSSNVVIVFDTDSMMPNKKLIFILAQENVSAPRARKRKIRRNRSREPEDRIAGSTCTLMDMRTYDTARHGFRVVDLNSAYTTY